MNIKNDNIEWMDSESTRSYVIVVLLILVPVVTSILIGNL